MLRPSFRELGRVSLWYCEDVYCVLLASGYGVCSPRENSFFLLHKVISEAILDNFGRFIYPSLQLHICMLYWGGGGGGVNWVIRVGGE